MAEIILELIMEWKYEGRECMLPMWTCPDMCVNRDAL